MYESMLLPSLNRVKQFIKNNNLPDIQIIEVSGTTSMTENYNKGLAQAIYPIKFYIHEDVDIMDNINEIPVFLKIALLFAENPDVGMIGMVGTKKAGNGFWWDDEGLANTCGRVLTTERKIYAQWKCNFSETDVETVDGFFMATNHNIPWNEDITGFHFYDCDYCNTIRLTHNKKIMVHNHLCYHYSNGDGAYSDVAQRLKTYFMEKWVK